MNLPGRRLPRTFCQIDRTENDFEFGGNQTSKLSEKHYIYIRLCREILNRYGAHTSFSWGRRLGAGEIEE
jgi:hypothetical protein